MGIFRKKQADAAAPRAPADAAGHEDTQVKAEAEAKRHDKSSESAAGKHAGSADDLKALPEKFESDVESANKTGELSAAAKLAMYFIPGSTQVSDTTCFAVALNVTQGLGLSPIGLVAPSTEVPLDRQEKNCAEEDVEMALASGSLTRVQGTSRRPAAGHAVLLSHTLRCAGFPRATLGGKPSAKHDGETAKKSRKPKFLEFNFLAVLVVIVLFTSGAAMHRAGFSDDAVLIAYAKSIFSAYPTELNSNGTHLFSPLSRTPYGRLLLEAAAPADPPTQCGMTTRVACIFFNETCLSRLAAPIGSTQTPKTAVEEYMGELVSKLSLASLSSHIGNALLTFSLARFGGVPIPRFTYAGTVFWLIYMAVSLLQYVCVFVVIGIDIQKCAIQRIILHRSTPSCIVCIG